MVQGLRELPVPHVRTSTSHRSITPSTAGTFYPSTLKDIRSIFNFDCKKLILHRYLTYSIIIVRHRINQCYHGSYTPVTSSTLTAMYTRPDQFLSSITSIYHFSQSFSCLQIRHKCLQTRGIDFTATLCS